MTTREVLMRLDEGVSLHASQIESFLNAIYENTATDVEIAAFLTALHFRGESAAELAGATRVLRLRCEPFPRLPGMGPLLDTCGTGGDGSASVNVSTAAALIAAACGVRVAKHGNRSATGVCGSADVLAALGIAIDIPPARAAQILAELGITFLFAPRYHGGLKALAPIRRQLPFPTLMNLVGPLANPALPEFQLVGAPQEDQADLIAEAILNLGVQRAAVVTGGDGLDEITLDGPTWVRWVDASAGEITIWTWEPRDFGLPRVPMSDLRVRDVADSVARLSLILQGKPDPARNVILANSAAALLLAGVAPDLKIGVERAAAAVDSGAVWSLIQRWRDATNAPSSSPSSS